MVFKKHIWRKKLGRRASPPQWQKYVFLGLSLVRPESKRESDVPWLGPSRGVVPCMPTVPEVGLRLGTYLIYKRKRRTSTLRCTYLTGLSWSCYLENPKQNYLSDLLTTCIQEMLAHLKRDNVNNDKHLFLCQGLAPASRRSSTSSGWP